MNKKTLNKKIDQPSNALFDNMRATIYDAVKKQLDDFDAYSLLAESAPNDEFESEAKEIANKIRPNMSADHIAAVMADEMKFSFGDEQFTKDKFLPYAEKIHKELNKTVSELSKDGDILVLYKVAFNKFGSKYSYLYDGDEFIKVGDKVIVPVGDDYIETQAEVSSIETLYHKHGSPPLFDFKLKSIISKVDEPEYADSITPPDDNIEEANIDIDIKILKDDFQTPVDAQTIENAIFVEDTAELFSVSKIILSGKYNYEYTVVSHFIRLDTDKVIIDNGFLIIILFSELAIIDLEQNKLLRVIDFHCWELFRIFKFKSGYFIHGEGENRFLNKHFDVVWKEGCIDIFFNPEADPILEIFDDYVTVFDWYGYKHYYDETGEFKTEHYKEYDFS